MKKITQEEFEALVNGAKILARSRTGPKVYDLGDGRVLKVFFQRRLISSALWRPYSTRFVRAAAALRERGIATVEVLSQHRLRGRRWEVVVYRKLPGISLREHLKGGGGDPELIWKRFAGFVAALHQRGIYFKSLHLGNVLAVEGGEFGLIDMTDLQTSRFPLSQRWRARNLRHVLRYPEDRAAAEAGIGLEGFVRCYLREAKIAPEHYPMFAREIARIPGMGGFGSLDRRRAMVQR